jgi:ubiquinone/menaquinone biosynthesis C-methylase UbiE
MMGTGFSPYKRTTKQRGREPGGNALPSRLTPCARTSQSKQRSFNQPKETEEKMQTLALRKPHADRGIEGLAAKWYAANTAEMMKEYIDLAQRVAAQLPESTAVLEVAPGPGYFSIELAKRGVYDITGLDISHSMVKIASKKAAEAGVKVDFQQGSASNIPFPAGSFDFLLCRAAFKNFALPMAALKEMCRVLKPGGRGVIIDLKRNASPQEISRGIDAMGLSWFNRRLTKLVFKTMLLKSAYTKEEFQQMLWETKFRNVEIEENYMGLELWMTK